MWAIYLSIIASLWGLSVNVKNLPNESLSASYNRTHFGKSCMCQITTKKQRNWISLAKTCILWHNVYIAPRRCDGCKFPENPKDRKDTSMGDRRKQEGSTVLHARVMWERSSCSRAMFCFWAMALSFFQHENNTRTEKKIHIPTPQKLKETKTHPYTMSIYARFPYKSVL